MHLAGAVGTLTCSIFVGLGMPWETGVYAPGHVVLSSRLACAPCQAQRGLRLPGVPRGLSPRARRGAPGAPAGRTPPRRPPAAAPGRGLAHRLRRRRRLGDAAAAPPGRPRPRTCSPRPTGPRSSRTSRGSRRIRPGCDSGSGQLHGDWAAALPRELGAELGELQSAAERACARACARCASARGRSRRAQAAGGRAGRLRRADLRAGTRAAAARAAGRSPSRARSRACPTTSSRSFSRRATGPIPRCGAQTRRVTQILGAARAAAPPTGGQ